MRTLYENSSKTATWDVRRWRWRQSLSAFRLSHPSHASPEVICRLIIVYLCILLPGCLWDTIVSGDPGH
ncbi:hypothetical protein C8F04DRAFT_1402592 [Mycena alexandri]|uniref:Uncharacterized protein n=1 Tax=Mycena alexandri TaxID=1745969 RepID=A0AAD6WUZ4_9AGAR|nr:hypothetical protein C8F04DRAFT_1402592 [Mycena alexandri]